MNTAQLSSSLEGPLSWRLAGEVGGCQIALERGQVRGWRSSRETIHVRQGIVWITEEGDRHDTILNAGESLRVTKSGRVVAEAVGGRAELLIQRL